MLTTIPQDDCGCEKVGTIWGLLIKIVPKIYILLSRDKKAKSSDTKARKCDAESFSVWREDIRFIKDGGIFTFDLDAADDILDFAIYLCNECGKWTTYIE